MEPNNYKEGMKDKLAYASDTPDIEELNFEFKRSVYNGSFSTGLEELDDMRFCRWDGQSNDGKKYSDIRTNGNPIMIPVVIGSLKTITPRIIATAGLM